MTSVEKMPPSAETIAEIERGFAIFRFVNGREIAGLGNNIRRFDDCDGIRIPTDKHGLVRVQIKMIEDIEVKRNKDIFIANDLSRFAVREMLEEIPSFYEEIPATFTRTHWYTDHFGNRHLSIGMEEGTSEADKLYDERESAWALLEDKTGQSFERKLDIVPSAWVATFRKGVSEKGIGHFEKFVNHQLPIRANLPSVLNQTRDRVAA